MLVKGNLDKRKKKGARADWSYQWNHGEHKSNEHVANMSNAALKGVGLPSLLQFLGHGCDENV